MLEEDDSSLTIDRQSNLSANTALASSSRASEVRSEKSSVSKQGEAKAQQNSAILQASLNVAIQSKNQPLALLFKSAIAGINDLLKAQFGDNAIEVAASEDNTPSATADRIVSLSTGFFEAFKQQNPDGNASDVLSKFMDTIRSGFEKGAKEAQDILKGMGVLSGDISSNIDKTLELVRQGYADFEAAQRNSLASTTDAAPAAAVQK